MQTRLAPLHHELMAERATISRTTLTKVEKGDPSVSLGIYATVSFVLGMVSNLASLFDKDELGRSLEEENLPLRVRLPKISNGQNSKVLPIR